MAELILINRQAADLDLFVEPWGMNFPLKPGVKVKCVLAGSSTPPMYWEVEIDGDSVLAHANGPAVDVEVAELDGSTWKTLWRNNRR